MGEDEVEEAEEEEEAEELREEEEEEEEKRDEEEEEEVLWLGRKATAPAPRPAEDAEGKPQHLLRMLSPVTLLRSSRSCALAVRMDQGEVKATGVQGPPNNQQPRS